MQPPAYSRFQNFAQWQSLNPSVIYIGTDFDGEFNRIKATFDVTLSNLAKIQRDDGKLANASVGRDQLRPEVVMGIGTPAGWQAATKYSARDSVIYNFRWYWAKVDHTSSSTFAADIAKWEQIADFSTITTQGSVTSVTGGSGLLGGTITTTGTLSVDVGTAAGKIVQLDGSARLPAVDGSQLTNLSGGIAKDFMFEDL